MPHAVPLGPPEGFCPTIPGQCGQCMGHNPHRVLHPSSLPQHTSGRARPLALIRSAGKIAQADAQVCCVDVASPHMRRSLCRGSWQSSGGLLSEFLPGLYPAESHIMCRHDKVMDRALYLRCLLTATSMLSRAFRTCFQGSCGTALERHKCALRRLIRIAGVYPQICDRCH